MAEENANPEVVEQEPAAAPPVIDPRDEEIKGLKMNYHMLSQSLETTNQLLQSVLQGGGRQAAPPTRRKMITEEELEEAFQNGKGAAKLKEFGQQLTDELVETHIAPLRQTGLGAIGDTVMELMRPKMPHFDRFQKEISVYLDAYTPDLRVNAKAIKAAYDAVVGAHIDEIVAEEVQKQVRQATTPVVTPKTSGRGRGRGDEVKEAEDLAPGALSGVGRSEEEFARKLGYKSWADYQKVEVGQ